MGNNFVSPLTGKTHDFVLVYGIVKIGTIEHIKTSVCVINGTPKEAVEIEVGCRAFSISPTWVEKELVEEYWPLQVGDRVCIVYALVDSPGKQRSRIFVVEVQRDGFVPPEPKEVDVGTGM